MVVSLDGIERFIFTVNPETKTLDTYYCMGYQNTGRFVRNPDNTKPDVLMPGKLVDMYKAFSGKGAPHSMEYLELLHQITGCPYVVVVNGQKSYL